MDIKTLLSNIHQTTETFDVSGISLNSNTLSKGDLFIALQGEKIMAQITLKVPLRMAA